jgi:hypothetical protein
MWTVVQTVAGWLLVGLAAGMLFGLMVQAGRRDRLHHLQECCRWHEWIRLPGAGLVCRQCEWVAGQRGPVGVLGEGE